MTERINRAVSDCLILCAYAQGHPRDVAAEYLQALRNDPLWDNADVEVVDALVMGLLAKLQRSDIDTQGWLK
jgi:hypothetical protein